MKRVLARLDKVHAQINATVAELDNDWFQRQPPDGGWSVAEIIQHLNLVEDRVTKDLKKSFAAPGARVGMLRRFIPTSIVASRIVRVQAPKGVNPTNAPEKQAVIENFNDARARLKSLCAEKDTRDFRQVTFTHPFLGKIDGVAAVSFLGYHEKRHYKQIHEVLRKLKSSDQK
ncbi:MAG TPA: DinB family protein [Pyrinomonadaceae bacterium]|nr:DinB family protein [Pyrinomonadaceae bacterium]